MDRSRRHSPGRWYRAIGKKKRWLGGHGIWELRSKVLKRSYFEGETAGSLRTHEVEASKKNHMG